MTLRAVATLVRSWFSHVWVDPIRDGRLRLRGGAVGLGTLSVAASIAIGLSLLVIAGARWLRATLPVEVSANGLGAPSSLQWVIVALLVLAIALVQTSALHSAWWTRVLALLTSAVYLSALGVITTTPSTGVRTALIVGAAWAALLLLSLIRIRGHFAWWEFALVFAILVAATAFAAYASLPQANAGRPGAYLDFAWLMLIYVGSLSAPLIMAAGYAVAEVAYTSIVWGADLLRQRLPRIVLIAGIIGVFGWRLTAVVWGWIDTLLLSSTRIAWAAGLLLVAVLVGRLLDHLADRHFRRNGSTTAATVHSDLQRILLPVAVLSMLGLIIDVGVGTIVSYLASVSGTLGAMETQSGFTAAGRGVDQLVGALGSRWATIVLTALLFAVAVWRASRGDRGLAELIGMVALLRAFDQLHGLEVTTYYLPLVATVAAAALLGAWAALRRLTLRRALALAVVALLAAAFGSRDLFADPLAIVLGGSAAVLFGLAWGFATGAGSTGEDSRRFPRASRTLFFLGNTLLGVSVVAFNALVSNTSGSLDIDALTTRGDRIFGGALLLAAMVSVLFSAVRDREVGPPTT